MPQLQSARSGMKFRVNRKVYRDQVHSDVQSCQEIKSLHAPTFAVTSLFRPYICAHINEQPVLSTWSKINEMYAV